MVPLPSKVINPESKSESKVAMRGRPFSGSSLSGFVESLQGLMCDARMASTVRDPVTQQL